MKKLVIIIVLLSVRALGQGVDNTYCPNTNIPNWGSSDGPATLPNSCYNTASVNTPATGSVVNVAANNATDLQNKLTAAACGQQITLPAGSVYSGNFTLPALSCPSNNYLWIVTGGLASLPGESGRYAVTYNSRTLYVPQMTPCFAGVTSLPGRPLFRCPTTPGTYTSKLITTNNNPALTFTTGTSHIRVIGLEFARTAATGLVSDLILTGNVGAVDHVIFDRIWCHGTESGDETNRCLRDDSVSFFAVIDSYLNDFYCFTSCTDSKAIGGGTNNINSTTENTIKIVNNYLEAAGENILHGGGASNTTPENLEIRLNLMFKPLFWSPQDPSYTGGFGGNPVIVKNPGEFKNAQLVIVEGNQFQNTWAGFSQKGQGFTVTPVNQGGACTTCFISNLTIRFNSVNTANTFGEFSIVSNSSFIAAGGNHWSIHDNLADNLGYCGVTSIYCPDSQSHISSISASTITTAGQALHDITFDHNTLVYASVSSNRHAFGVSGPTIASTFNESNITFTNNIFSSMFGAANGQGGSDPLNCANTGNNAALFTQCWLPITFNNNCFVNNNGHTWPGTNVTTVSSYSTLFTNYNNGNGGTYTVAAGACKGAGTSGTDPGANITTLYSTLSAGVNQLVTPVTIQITPGTLVNHAIIN